MEEGKHGEGKQDGARYDIFNNIISSQRSSDSSVTTVRTFDSLNRPKTATLPFDVELDYSYAYDQDFTYQVTVDESYAGSFQSQEISTYDADNRLVQRD